MRYVLFFLTFILTSCNSVDQKAESEKLKVLSIEWVKAARENDLDKAISYWAPNAMLILPNDEIFDVKKDIRYFFQIAIFSKYPNFAFNWRPKEAFVSKSGDIGYVLIEDTLTTTSIRGNRRRIDKFSFYKGIEIWKKQENSIWNIVFARYEWNGGIFSEGHKPGNNKQ